jgi:hypothetical protein
MASTAGNDDDVTVEDDIVPSTVGLFSHHDPPCISSSMSASGMSVITMDSITDHAKAEHLETPHDDETTYKFDRTATPLDIDFAIDMHSSVILTVLIFAFFMVTSLESCVRILDSSTPTTQSKVWPLLCLHACRENTHLDDVCCNPVFDGIFGDHSIEPW